MRRSGMGRRIKRQEDNALDSRSRAYAAISGPAVGDRCWRRSRHRVEAGKPDFRERGALPVEFVAFP